MLAYNIAAIGALTLATVAAGIACGFIWSFIERRVRSQEKDA